MGDDRSTETQCRACNTKVKNPIWQESKLVQDFMAVLVTCTFEDDSIKSEGAMGKYFIAQG